MSEYEGLINFAEEFLSIMARKSNMTALEYKAEKYATKSRYLETLSLEKLEKMTFFEDDDLEMLRMAFMHKKRTEKS